MSIGENMHGVVLWSDRKCDRALIWCEDHGKLAFFNGQEERPDTLFEIEAGDLVRLEVKETRDFRLALNIELIRSEQYPQLADTLLKASTSHLPQSENVVGIADKSNILPFSRPRVEKTLDQSPKRAVPTS